MRAGNPTQASSALECARLLWVVAHSCFSSQNPLCATQNRNWWSLFMGWVPAQKRELAAFMGSKNLQNASSVKNKTHDKPVWHLHKAETLAHSYKMLYTCSRYRILTRKVSLCVGCNLGRIFLWQVNHVKARLLPHFLLSCFRVWCIYVSQSLIYLNSTVG